jgi:conjugal transfer pilus assembly protein TrbC
MEHLLNAWWLLAAMGLVSAAAVLIGGKFGIFPWATVGGAALCALVVACAQPTFAQTAEELAQGVQARAKAASAQAQELLDGIKGRDEAYREQAQTLVDENASRLKQGFSYLDDQQFDGASTMGAKMSGETQDARDGVVYVAVSFSMPPADLRRLGREAHRAGATVVIRGLVHGSFKETLLAAKQVFDEDSVGGVAIDPNVFRAFDIKQVPMFIAAKGPVEPCGKGLDCIPDAPPHDRISGNITLAEALKRLATDGTEAPNAAASARARLEAGA